MHIILRNQPMRPQFLADMHDKVWTPSTMLWQLAYVGAWSYFYLLIYLSCYSDPRETVDNTFSSQCFPGHMSLLAAVHPSLEFRCTLHAGLLMPTLCVGDAPSGPCPAPWTRPLDPLSLC